MKFFLALKENAIRILKKTNKYYITVFIFVVVTFFLGDSNIFLRYKYDSQINDLEKEIAYYQEQKQINEHRLEALKSDEESLERYAREEYLMTKPGEELFIIKP